jgi:hypothetical protein
VDQSLVKPVPARGDPALHVLELQAHGPVVDLVPERPQVLPDGSATPIPLEDGLGQNPLDDVADELHAHSLAHGLPGTEGADAAVLPGIREGPC